MRMQRKMMMRLIAVAVVCAAGQGAWATVFSVELEDSLGPHLFGVVDTTTDTFTITSWTENPGSPDIWRPAPGSFPMTLPALNSLGQSHDVPDDWDGTIPTWWGFVGPQVNELDWLDGTPESFQEARLGWGGGGFGTVISVNTEDNIFNGLPIEPSTTLGRFVQANITEIPEPASLGLLGLGLLVVARRRR